ncbi:MAG TPA: hypothetical protein VF837_05165 [Patescibacteria group bacterium]
MANDLVKRPEGRPTVMTEETMTKLESIFKIGGTILEACSYAGISNKTYYRWLEEDEDFVTKMEAAKHYADVAAKNVVVTSITKDQNLDTAKWWLEKREFRQGGLVNVQVNNYNDILKKINDD